MKIEWVIPQGLDFSDLKLQRDVKTGAICFDWALIEKICAGNNIDIALFKEQGEDYLKAAPGDRDKINELYLRLSGREETKQKLIREVNKLFRKLKDGVDNFSGLQFLVENHLAITRLIFRL